MRRTCVELILLFLLPLSVYAQSSYWLPIENYYTYDQFGNLRNGLNAGGPADSMFAYVLPKSTLFWYLPKPATSDDVETIGVCAAVPEGVTLIVATSEDHNNFWVCGKIVGPTPYDTTRIPFGNEPGLHPTRVAIQVTGDRVNEAAIDAVDIRAYHTLSVRVDSVPVEDSVLRWYNALGEYLGSYTVSNAKAVLPKAVPYFTNAGNYVFGR